MNSAPGLILNDGSVMVAAIRPMSPRRARRKINRGKPFASARVSPWVLFAVFLCALGATEFARGDELRCADTNVTVYSADGRDADIACEAAEEALRFLAANEVDTSGAIEVHLVSKLPDASNSPSYGYYDHPNRRVYMLFFSKCLERGPWEGLLFGRTLYKSLVTHEVAHAVAAANFTFPKPSLLAHEYIAYVTMFATMPPSERERVLRRLPGQGFDSVNQMSVTYYLMNPLQFGAEAYRHFLKQDDGKAFIKAVLSGRVSIGKSWP